MKIQRYSFLLLVALGLFLGFSHSAFAATFVVDSAADDSDNSVGDGFCDIGDGSCTLRAAIEEANVFPGADTINFDLVSGTTIILANPLDITSPITVDASSTGTCPTEPGIILSSSLAGYDIFDLGNGADGTTIRGFIMKGFTNGYGVNIADVSGSDTTIACNIIGLDENGDASGGRSGILISNSSNIIIGGPLSTDRNTISGNQEDGAFAVGFYDGSISDITIQNNYVGLSVDGTTAVLNGTPSEGRGVVFTQFDEDEQMTVENVNIIGNKFVAGRLELTYGTFDNITVQSNTFSTNAAGTESLNVDDSDSGILIGYASLSNVLIGGSSNDNLGNIFGGSAVQGIALYFEDEERVSSNIVIAGNRFGIGANDEVLSGSGYTAILSNGSQGVMIGGITPDLGNIFTNQSFGIWTIGSLAGDFVIQNNEIYGNTYGILVQPSTIASSIDFAYATILQNRIYSNSAADIKLGEDTDDGFPDDPNPSSNDPLDSDEGPNDYLNRPVLISGTQTGGDISVTYLLDVPVSTYPYRIEFFSNPSGLADSGFGGGEVYEGYANQTISSAGPQLFTSTITSATLTQGITATITPCLDADCTTYGGTSEFSNSINGTTRGVDRGTATGTQTDFADNGAYHIITANFLGISVAPDTNTTADETDRDGVEFDQVSYTPGTAEMTITVTAESEGYISAWMDSNQDGDFSDEGELVIDNQSVSVGANEFVIALPQQVGEFNFRIRYTTYDHDGILPTGEALDGEVEDYAITIASVAVVRRVIGSLPKPSQPTTPSQPETILNSGTCPAHLIITNFMKQGDRDGKYSLYYKGTITEVKILQAHINRILKAQYQQASGPEDGIFGRLTAQGVARLQTALNLILKPTPLLKVDSIVGPFTRSAINNSCGGM